MRIGYEEVKAQIKMKDILALYGLEANAKGDMPCPIHGGDNKTGFGVHDQGTRWTCRTRGCGKASTNIDFVSLMDKTTPQEAFIKIKKAFNMIDDEPIRVKTEKKKKETKIKKGSVWYNYNNEDGSLAYRMERIEYTNAPKFFYPEMPDGKRACPKDARILYNLDKILTSDGDYILLSEGEKTAKALTDLGYIGTTFPFGCGSWMERYADQLADQKVILMPDADPAGDKWLAEIIKSIAGKVESTMVIQVPDDYVIDHPEFTGHDFADYIETEGREETMTFLSDALAYGTHTERGIDRSSLNIATDICQRVLDDMKSGVDNTVIDFSSLYGTDMPVSAFKGDVVMMVAATSVGKTRLLQNIPYHYRDLNFVIFDLELSLDVLGRRYLALENRMSFREVRDKAIAGYEVNVPRLDNVFLPKIKSPTVEKIKEEVSRIEKMTGRTIHVVCVDYIGKMKGEGASTREIVGRSADDFKSYCNEDGRVGIVTTQIARHMNKDEVDYRMPVKEEAKHAGELENNCQIAFCYCMKSPDDRNTLQCRCDKYTHDEKPMKWAELSAEDMFIRSIDPSEIKDGGFDF